MNESMTVPGSARSSQSPNKYQSQNSGVGAYGANFRQNNKMSKDLRLKVLIQQQLDSKLVTIIMSLVTVFALIGVSLFLFLLNQLSRVSRVQDDVRVISTNKSADNYFFAALTLSFCLFTLEIVTTTVVIDDFKYSFFFYLDIIATLSLINDIPWLLNIVVMLFGQRPDYESVNAIPGVLYVENAASGKIAQALTSLRLIRLIRIIKLYKYFLKSQSKKNDEDNPNQV